MVGEAFNEWRGFVIEPSADPDYLSKCRLQLQHIRDVIADGHDDRYEYFCNWVARTFQHPAEAIGTDIVLRGKQGSGKSVVATQMIGRPFGNHFKHFSKESQFAGRFNSVLSDGVVMFADESFCNNTQNAGHLKALITEEFCLIEPKGKEQFKRRNFMHLIKATDQEHAAKCDPDARRDVIFDVSSRYANNKEYFSALHHEMDNGGREALFRYWRSRPIGNFRPSELPPSTEAALFRNKMLSMDSVGSWWYGMLCQLHEGAKLFWQVTDTYIDARADTVYASYRESQLGAGRQGLLPEPRFLAAWKTMVDVAPMVCYGMRYYRLPAREACEKAMQEAYKTSAEVMWDGAGARNRGMMQS